MRSRVFQLIVVAAFVGTAGTLTWWRLSTVADPGRSDNAAATPISVRGARVTRGTVQSWLFAEGTARSVRREYLTFEKPGRVVFVKNGPDGQDLREGAEVRAGELLAHQDQRTLLADIESAEATVREEETQVAVAEAERSRAQTEEELAAKTLQRFSVLLEQVSASKQEYDEAKASAALATASVSQSESRLAAARSKVTSAKARLKQAQLALEETELRAPINGIVAYVNVKEGYYFTPNLIRTDDETAALQTVPMVVLDPTAFEITVSIPSFSRSRVRAGQAAIVAVRQDALGKAGSAMDGEDVVRGTVFSVNPAVSPGGRAIQVKVRVTKNVKRLEDGLFVSVWLASESRADATRVPLDGLIYENNAAFAFVVEDGIAIRRPVELGLQEFTSQEVVKGLKEGELVVTVGRFRISDGAPVRVLDEPSEVVK